MSVLELGLINMTMQRVERLREHLLASRACLLNIMESYDVYEWQNSIKYLNADLTAIMALIQATLGEINELKAEHYDILIEYIEEVD
jgi:hypothetical protein